MEEQELVVVFSAAGRTEAEQIVRLLKENEIPAVRKGGVMDVYMGNSITGEEILVSLENLDTAKKILEGFQPISTSSGEGRRVYSKGQKVIGWILLAVAVVLCVIIPILFL
ncbi:DUF2007 domain-containing protein [Lacrimispora sp. NSJ-141]|uniref:DUF2007 domain-containing protein n=1 Tax=Lientehia hominis TaxID=2897778 RepID=A0AAP2RIU7_9FIRM|nr:DUF2007 domain-containing protein [Lientehia hominis]MCD2491730.1 DUF2007 domain-containing protein [Lientehia hominis]